jgi:hypothetical protein
VVEGSGRCHTRRIAAHTSVCVGHASTSKIYSRACVGQKATQLMVSGSGETCDHGGEARLKVEFPEVDRYDFEKYKSKNLKNGVNLRLQMTVGG